jgi:epoxyqueuosine reductase QueG
LLYPGSIPIPLQQLGALAGWHHRSPLGLGVHERYGPWFGYRAAVLIDTVLPATSAAKGQSPCERCADKPCIAVCPAKALSESAPPDVGACADYRLAQGSPCALQCTARLACPVGGKHRYEDTQLRYYYGRSLQSIRAYTAGPRKSPAF